MSPWGPVVLIIFLTFTAIAIGVHEVIACLVSVLASYVVIVLSIGGVGQPGESRAMALGFGFMALIPAAAVTLLAAGLGHWVRRYLAKNAFNPLEEIGPSPIADSAEKAVGLALTQFRRGSAVRVKCPSCRRRLFAKRILSKTQVPDIEVVCPCGSCNGVHPFYPA